MYNHGPSTKHQVKPTTAIDTMSDQHLMKTYNRLPVAFSRGEGCWLYDANDKKYLDGLCGISVTSLGHAHPAVTATIAQQANALLHTSNLYHIEAQEQLADQLCALGNMDRAFFSNSGAEANEAALKIARLHAHNHGNNNPQIITFSGSFHGRTLATIAATGNSGIKEGFAPTMPGFIHLPFNDIEAVTALFAQRDDIAAVLVEPVQGEGGVNIASPHFLATLQTLCKASNALFMLDEIQSGNGRCGRYFAHQLLDGGETAVQPDVITLAKALGNGIPVGACLAKGDAANTLVAGKHGSTFGGNPFACSVASTVVRTIQEQNLAARAEQLGALFLGRFKNALKSQPKVADIRGCGLMLGIELDEPCAPIMQKGLDAGIVINVTAGNVVRLLPPLIMSDDEALLLADTTLQVIADFIS